MSRITTRFEQLRKTNQRALITYITAGDPKPQLTPKLLHALAEAGADILELGIPFSDPTADGPSIDAAHQRALAHGVTLTDTLAAVATFRAKDNKTPVVLMGYLNPIEALGAAEFAQAAANAGVDGIIVVDLPPEEAGPIQVLLRERGIDLIFLIAPTTTDERIKKIASVASGFLYYVSLKGITGSKNLDAPSVASHMARIRQQTNLATVVGFGIRSGESAARLAENADGVVVGSALVEQIYAEQNDDERLRIASQFVAQLRTALNNVTTTLVR